MISVDAKKKELIGDFKNAGRQWRPAGTPQPVQAYDFPVPGLGRATPFGVYDLSNNIGWVSVGMDHDTSAFAVETIRRWWYGMGQPLYHVADRLLITADGGGSNGSRVRLWKAELQKLADETRLQITVAHLPPGTSKWNKIEHRLFSSITSNWRGEPLISYAVIVSLIGKTATETGLVVHSELDTNLYPTGVSVSDEVIKALNILRDTFHGDWNYTMMPREATN